MDDAAAESRKVSRKRQAVIYRAEDARNVVGTNDFADAGAQWTVGRDLGEVRGVWIGLGPARLSRKRVSRTHRRRSGIGLASDAGARGKVGSGDLNQPSV